jgi:8-oxo-dGTP diphosphatase
MYYNIYFPFFPDKTMRVVGAAVAVHNNCVLLCRRAGGALSGWWEFPGGKLEDNETIEECITREMLEELGVCCVVQEHIASVEHSYPHGKFLIQAHRVTLTSPDLTLKCHSEFAWIPIIDLPMCQYKILDSNVPIVAAIVAQTSGLLINQK